MADQVNPTGGLVPGLSSQLLAAASPRSAPETPRPAKPAEPQAQEPGHSPVSDSAKSPDKAMEQVNGHLQEAGTELKFQVDKATGRTVYKVVNPSNGQVLLQVPSDEMLALARNVRAMQQKMGSAGVLVDKEG